MPCRRLLAQLPTPTMPIAIFPIRLARVRGRHQPVHRRAPYTQRREGCKSPEPARVLYFLRKRDGKSGGKSGSGWITRALVRSCASVSGSSGFGTEQSTGHTTAHWSKTQDHYG